MANWNMTRLKHRTNELTIYFLSRRIMAEPEYHPGAQMVGGEKVLTSSQFPAELLLHPTLGKSPWHDGNTPAKLSRVFHR